jgi:hypothetical protein
MSTDDSAFFEDDDDEDGLPALSGIKEQSVKTKSKAKRAKAQKVDEGEQKMVKIQLEEVDNMSPTGQFFGLNGKGFNLRPGEPAIVPMGILSILNDALMSVAVLDGNQTVTGYRDRLRFPYRILG